MSDVLIDYVRQSLPKEVEPLLDQYLSWLATGDFKAILESTEAKTLLEIAHTERNPNRSQASQSLWSDSVFERLCSLLSTGGNDTINPHDSPSYKQHAYFIVGLAAFFAFLQSNVTGPPLQLDILSSHGALDNTSKARIRSELVSSLGMDGEAAYRLTPQVELFCLAEAVVLCPAIAKNVRAASWARLRIDFWHQKLLSEPAPSLQKMIFERLDSLDDELSATGNKLFWVNFLLEKAVIHTHHGFDKLAREDLNAAARTRRFESALTGRLGKRTKFQQKDTSQLVVLARSGSSDTTNAPDPNDSSRDSIKKSAPIKDEGSKPQALDLNDDTLLESISFTKQAGARLDFIDDESLPESLKTLNPEDQPRLDALDSIILLALAASITNTSPEDGLTREETAPYATRVLDGGSSNWQVYTQALLLRSRVEAYRSRTVERGLLQLQAVVDQVIAETTVGAAATDHDATATTFLPPVKPSESAPVAERLRYVCQLPSSSRWELEAELASRWVSLGGLRSALGIYERLEMWAEAALCWAATDREDKASRIVRRQLFHATSGKDAESSGDNEKWEGPARDPPPSDAPRLYCILGDLDKEPAMYEKAWEVSNGRYARAQRSLGRLYYAAHDHVKAAHAYAQAVQVNQTNQTSWFALGCALLELREYQRAAEAFSRTVQMDDTDAEAWSNLAVALMNIDPSDDASRPPPVFLDDEEPAEGAPVQPPADKSHRDALVAFKRAATLKHHSHRIWDNVLTIAASVIPPSYSDIVTAQTRLIDLRGSTVGETCIDAQILDLLVRHIITADIESGGTGYNSSASGLPRLVVQLVDTKVVPLITASAPLWKTVSRLALWRRKPSTALEAEEKAWRCVASQPGWEYGTEDQWNKVVDATIELIDAYQSLGEMERTEGLGAGDAVLVAKDWKFKAKSAVKSITGRGKDGWEGTDGWDRLKEALGDLKG